MSAANFERQLLGACLSGEASPQELRLDDMPMPAHREILRALQQVHADGVKPTDTLVRARLIANGVHEEIWAVELVELMFAGCAPENFRYHLNLHRANLNRSRLKGDMATLSQRIDPTVTDAEIKESVERLLALAQPADDGDVPHISHGLEALFNPKSHPSPPWGVGALAPLRVEPSDLCVIGARPGAGKTAMLGTMALAAAREGWNVLFLSLEMPRIQIQQRLLAGFSGVNLSAVKDASDANIARYASDFAKLPIWVEDASVRKLDVERIGMMIRGFARSRSGPCVVLVDYLQLINTQAQYRMRYELLGHVCRELKSAAKSGGVPVIVGAQVSRAVEQRGADAGPGLADLRESGEIENTADEVLLLHRTPDAVKFAVAKYRNGEMFMGRMHFNGPLCLFQDGPAWAEHWQEPQ